MYRDWGEAARAFILRLHEELGETATLDERRKCLRAHAWEFHGGTSWGKKVWSRESRKYLERHGLPPRTPATASPQSKLFDRLQSGDVTFPFRSTPQQ